MSDDEKFRLQLHEASMMIRKLGQQEFRIAAMRWLEHRAYTNLARELGNMDVDKYLTAEEIANRDKLP
jgi:hypothetical protein